MTATATPTSKALTEWTKVFPKQITENYTSSVTFMKQLTVIAISTISYLKNAFPEESYSLENFGGLKLRILKKKCRDELAHFLSTALTQAFEAFDKKYLHQLALCFYEDECKVENLMEYHVFEYSYNTDGVTMSVHSKTRDSAPQTSKYSFDSVRERTVHLVRACVVIMQTCQLELPENYDVSLRLYYNEEAPEGYQAPGFSASADADDHLEASARDTIKLGCVETPFHKLVARSYIKDSLGASHEAIPSQNPPIMTQMEHEDFSAVPPEASAPQPDAGALRCPCNRPAGDADAGPLLLCHYCGTQQHAACFGLAGGAAGRVALHCCARCATEQPGRAPTDQRLAPLSRNKRECLCIFRRALWTCSVAGEVSGASLRRALGVSAPNAAKLVRLLASHRVVAHGDGHDAPQKVIPENLQSVMSKFFQVSEENLVDRLLAESFASQESQPDPVGEVLGPLEKVSLQQATNVGRVIDNSQEPEQPDVEDLTLKEYKEALLSNYQEDDDMSLSGSRDPIKDITNLGRKRNAKRKVNDDVDADKPRLRTGVRTKRAKTKA